MRSLGYVPSKERMPGILVILTSFPEARLWTASRLRQGRLKSRPESLQPNKRLAFLISTDGVRNV